MQASPSPHGNPPHPDSAPRARSVRVLRTSTSVAEAATICRVEGDLDAYQAPLVRERFSHLSGRTAVVIDLVAVRFVDSCGLSVVRHWIRRLQAEGRTVHLRLAPGPVARLASVDRLAAATTLVAPMPQR